MGLNLQKFTSIALFLMAGALLRADSPRARRGSFGEPDGAA